MTTTKTQKSKYEIQAEKFLADTNTRMDVQIITELETLEGDKPGWKRCKYNVVFNRFHAKKASVVHTFEFTGRVWNADKKPYAMGAQREQAKRKKVTAYDVLACLTKHDTGSFRNFCYELGYNDDSLKAQKTYFDVQEELEKVRALWGDVLEQLQEIQ